MNVLGKWNDVDWVEVASLIIDDGGGPLDYQRKEVLHFKEWDWGLYDPIRVADRNGSGKHVADGGQRVRNAKRFGILRLPAIITKSDGPISEAKYFVDVFKGRKPLSAIDKYRAGIVSGNERCTALKAILDKYGLTINDTSGWPRIRSVSGLLQQSLESIDFALGIISEVWNGNEDALREPIIVGLASFYSSQNATDTKFDRKRLIRKLSVIDPLVVFQYASTFRQTTSLSRPQLFGYAIAAIYNKRK